MKHPLLAVSSLAVLALAAIRLPGQWALVPAVPPAGLTAMAYDEDRGRIVGLEAVALSTTLRTWEYDGAAWTQVAATTNRGSQGLAMTYDTRARRVLLVLAADARESFMVVHSYDGRTWTEHTNLAGPPAHVQCTAAFDEARGRLVVYATLGASYLYEWDGTTWFLQQPPNPPPSRTNGRLVHDRLRQVSVLAGGQVARCRYDTATWEWDGTQWRNGGAALARDQHGMAYDTARRNVVAFGGQVYSSDCNYWQMLAAPMQYDSGAWQLLPAGPPAVIAPLLAHDLGRGRLVALVRSSASVWELAVAQAATYAPIGRGCAGPATLVLHDGRLPWTGATFVQRLQGAAAAASMAWLLMGTSKTWWGLVPLPLDVSFTGMTGCTLFTSIDAAVPFALAAGTGTVSLVVPNAPWLLGLTLFGQCALPDPAANAAGVVLSNAREFTIGS